MEDSNIKNYSGVVLGKKRGDFVAGASSPVPFKIINKTGDWSGFLPEHELQNRGKETAACTLFSGNNARETLFQYSLFNGLIPSSHVLFLKKEGYIKNGLVNFSDRYPAQYAEIEPGVGTFLWKANNSLRKNTCPEDVFPYSNDYFSITSKEEATCKSYSDRFNEMFTINWYWVDNPEEWIKVSPLQAVVRFANGDGVLSPQGQGNHAIMVYNLNNPWADVFESYNQKTKRYNKAFVTDYIGYTITYNNTSMDTNKFIKENDLKFVRNINTGEFGRIMQGKLRTISTEDRGTLLLLDNEHRKNGVSIPDSEWALLPKENF